MAEDFKKGLLKTLWIIRDYLPSVIIGGGWAPLIYYHYLINDKSKEPIRTKDIDLFVKIKVPVEGDKTVDQLLIQSGLESKFRSSDIPPVVNYEGDIEGENVIIEFLTDQRGALEDVTIEVQKGLYAVALRFVSVILENPVEVILDDLVVEGESQPLRIRVPAPAAYIFHKGLIFSRRKNQFKKAKDLYYIFDILANCPDLYKGIIDELRLYRQKYSHWFPKFRRNMETYFSDNIAEGIVMVLSQRPKNAFPELAADQFKQYVLGIFQELLEDIKDQGTFSNTK